MAWESGIRKFSDTELKALRVMECLKKSGLEIKDIRKFMGWCTEGPSLQWRTWSSWQCKKLHEKMEVTDSSGSVQRIRTRSGSLSPWVR